MAFNETRLIRRLPEGELDIIGDIHGELSAFRHLLEHLGYRHDWSHPQGRHAVFVGDLCDRGPHSPEVLRQVIDGVAAGRCFAVLGNHEINLLAGDAKDGSGWFFPKRKQDAALYAPWDVCSESERAYFLNALAQWPLILYRDDIVITHAGLTENTAERIAAYPDWDIIRLRRHFADLFEQQWRQSPYYDSYLNELATFGDTLDNPDATIPFLPAYAQYIAERSQNNPITACTTGIEIPAGKSFFMNGQWRFTIRCGPWEDYRGTPMVVGHYWRSWYDGKLPENRVRLFSGSRPTAWLGLGRVFCIDYSVGSRWRDRKQGIDCRQSRHRLAALRWPECRLVFDDGQETAAEQPSPV